jgi:DNA-binding transcriptional MerR regulator
VKISELSRRSGVTISSIKYYIREGLLRSGTPLGDGAAKNQARYGDQHLKDLALIRALRERAGISIASLRTVLSAIAEAESGHRDSLAVGVRSVEVERQASREGLKLDPDEPEYRAAWSALEQLMGARGWNREEDEPEIQELLAAMVAVGHVWPYELPNGIWAQYAELGAHAASFEIPEGWDPDRFPSETLRYAIVGTYIFEPVILAFRRLALSQRSTEIQQRNRESDDREALDPSEMPWRMPARPDDTDSAP